MIKKDLSKQSDLNKSDDYVKQSDLEVMDIKDRTCFTHEVKVEITDAR